MFICFCSKKFFNNYYNAAGVNPWVSGNHVIYMLLKGGINMLKIFCNLSSLSNDYTVKHTI
jgi:hypothetical protein